MNIPEIKLPSDVVFSIGSLPVTNAVLATWLVMLLVIIFALLVRRKAGVVPSRLQVFFEFIMDFLLDKMVLAFGSRKRALKFFPLVFTIFLFLLFANQFALLPFVESIVVGDVNLFRNPASDYSLPIIMSFMVLLLAHILAFFAGPLRHIGNYIKIGELLKIRKLKDIPNALLEFFLGLLDIIGEFAKLASHSTRLFGNMFAGAVVTGIISGLAIFTQFIVPIPFVALGILAGAVQAFVFAMLSILFISSTVDAARKPVSEEELEKEFIADKALKKA